MVSRMLSTKSLINFIKRVAPKYNFITIHCTSPVPVDHYVPFDGINDRHLHHQFRSLGLIVDLRGKGYHLY